MNNIEELVMHSKKYKVLYVEDDVLIRNEYKMLFEIFFDDVSIAVDGEDGLNKFKSDSFDLVVSDLEMPKLSGIELLREIRKLNETIPLVILSAYDNSDFFIKTIDIGIDGYIVKPIKSEQVFNVFSKIIYKLKVKEESKQTKRLLQIYKDTVEKNMIVVKINSQGLITFVNNHLCTISGFKESELLGKSYKKLVHKKDNQKSYADVLKSIIEIKEPWQGQINCKSKCGKYYCVKTIINPILDKKGNIKEYILINVDNTEEENVKVHLREELASSNKNLSQAVQLSKEYEKAMDNSNILSRTNLRGVITYVNDKFCEISGYTREELIGAHHNIIRHEDTASEVFKDMWVNIRNGKTWNGVLKNKKKSSLEYWVKTTVIPISDENNSIVEYMAIRQDLTELFELHKEVEDTQREIIYKMGEVGESRSKETGSHVKRVAHYSKILALLSGMDEKSANILFTASPMHDIGKVGIPDTILNKRSKLSDEEFEIMKTHSKIGYRVLKGSNQEVLKAAATVALEHHEKWNGSGYPQGLRGNDIHIYGRITAIADVLDALGSDRVYKKAWDLDKILDFFKKEKGEHFDPVLVDLLFDNLPKFLTIRDKYLE